MASWLYLHLAAAPTTLSVCGPFSPAGAVTPVAPCHQDDPASGDRQVSQEVQRGPEAQESSARGGRAGEAGAVRERERLHAHCTLVRGGVYLELGVMCKISP